MDTLGSATGQREEQEHHATPQTGQAILTVKELITMVDSDLREGRQPDRQALLSTLDGVLRAGAWIDLDDPGLQAEVQKLALVLEVVIPEKSQLTVGSLIRNIRGKLSTGN